MTAATRQRSVAVAALLLCVAACSSDDPSSTSSTTRVDADVDATLDADVDADDDADVDADVDANVDVNGARCLDAPIADEPVLDLLDGALAAVTRHYGAAPELFEVSIDQQRVSMVAAVDGAEAEQSFFCGAAGFAPPESLGEAEGETFAPSAIDVDPDAVFDGVRAELDEPEIVELVIVGGADGTTRMAVSVRSAAGGVIFVEIGPDGDVLSVRAL